ncbi:MAG: DMT family transporter [Planctomycetes bacterium]|nr:DMT family transporter [Planctomycetota bacterium]
MNSPWPIIVLLILAGGAVALQGASNSALASRISLPNALIVNTLVVLAGTLLYALLHSLNPMSPRPSLFSREGIVPEGTPWSHYLGGLCGFTVIAVSAYAIPKLGVGLSIALLVLGQGLAALALDHFGALGLAATPVTATRLLGVLLLAAGVLLVRR